MRSLCALIGLFLLSGCASRSITNDLARDRILEIPASVLEKEDIEVWKVTRVGGSEAIAETRLKTAFRLEKVNGEWAVREVRIGHGQWEKVSNLVESLEAVKIDETKQMLGRIAAAIIDYRSSNGTLPVFKDYVDLSDQLSPKYLTPLIRLDSWRQPLSAERKDYTTIVLQSAGPDGKHGTNDDIRETISR
jgi:hypothetical protein